LLIVLVPADEQVAAPGVINGISGVVNIAALLNEADANEVQLPFPAVTVYEVPTVIPLTNPFTSIAIPAVAGAKV
jgi:hypothetical protein